MKKIFAAVAVSLFCSGSVLSQEVDQDFDLDSYISFEPYTLVQSDWVRKVLTLKGVPRETIYNALLEISSTVEGQEIIKKAYDQENIGEIRFMYQFPIFLLPSMAIFSMNDLNGEEVFVNNIRVGTADYNARYKCDGVGNFAEVSIQRILFHEIYHLANHRNLITEGITEDKKMSLETQSVTATDEFMAKYYGECNRVNYLSIDLSGNGLMDFNSNFVDAATQKNRQMIMAAFSEIRMFINSSVSKIPQLN